jgi:spermidine synthase
MELMNNPLAKSVYYTEESGIGRTMAVARSRKPVLNLGLLGLGVGTVLGYGQPGDSATVYEISPKIVTLAGPEAAEFTVFSASPARPTLQLGDGRFLLEKEPPDKLFDVLLVDTFSGGNVPWHLLTREAFQTYFQHVPAGGYVVLHVTNYLPLDRLVLANARAMGLAAAVIECPSPENPVRLTPYDRHSVFVVLSRTWEDIAHPGLVLPARALLASGMAPGQPGHSQERELARKLARGSVESLEVRPWTDDRSSLSRLLFAR